jgi:RNA polymerase sigma-70 factor, ECF subfamily
VSFPPADTVEALLAAARSGRAEALGQLLELFRPYLRVRAAAELAADLQAKAGASDLIQDTYAAAYQAFPRFQGRTEPELRAWLQTILAHQAINFANQFRHTDKRRLSREQSLDDSGPAGPLHQLLPTDSPSPSGRALRREEAEALEAALNRLPEDYRRVIELHHRDARPFDQIAGALGRSEAAVRKLWARAVERWQQEVEGLYGPP